MSTEMQQRADTMPESPLQHVNAGGGDLAFMRDTAAFNHLWRVATAYSRSRLVPVHFQGKIDDCFIACQLAIRLNVDPFMLMQGMYVVHGRPGMEAKLQIALANQRGPFVGPIRFSMSGSGANRSCKAFAVDKATGETVDMEVTWAMVEAEGWDKPKGSQPSKWVTMPELMFRYRAASMLIRLYCPEVVMGIPTTEEIADTAPVIIDHPRYGGKLDALMDGTVATAGDLPSPNSASDARATNLVEEDGKPVDTPPNVTNVLSEDDKVTLDQWREFLAGTSDLKEIADAEAALPSSTPQLLVGKIRELCEMRRAEIRGSRGARSNGGQLFGSKASATEAGQ